MKASKIHSFHLSFFCFLLITSTGCSHQKGVSPEEYLARVSDPKNGLAHEQILGDYKFVFQYIPSECMVLRELLNDGIKPTKNKFDSLLKSYSGLQYAMLKIGTVSGNEDMLKQDICSEEEYFNRIQYFTTVVQNDLLMVDGKDTLPCAMHHFERTFSVSSFNTIMLGFENNTTPSDRTIIYADQVLGTGKVNFFISKEALSNLPLIEF